MQGSWGPLFSFLALLLLLMVLRRVLNQHLPGVIYLLTRSEELAFLFYFLLLLPGVVLHELSHWLAAKLLGVRVGSLSLGPKSMDGGKRIEMGAVRIGSTDPFRESLIGVAPLVTGSALILYLAECRLGVEVLSSQVIVNLPVSIGRYLSAPDVWIWVYLIFAVSNAMLPSESDRRPWWTLLLYTLVMALVFYFVGGIRQIPEPVLGLGLTSVQYLSWAFGLTIAVDLLVVLLLLAVEALIWLLLGRRLDWL